MSNVISSMLPKKVPVPTAAPKSRPLIDEDYVDVKAQGKAPDQKADVARGSTRQGTQAVPDSKALSTGGMETPTLHPLLSSLGFTADEVSAILRDELLAARSGGHHEGSLADWKHYYTAAASQNFSTTEYYVSMLAPAGGTTTGTRTGATITARKLRAKFTMQRVITGTPTVATYDPTYFVAFIRDKIPTTPGTCPTLHGVDTIPPSSGTLLFSQLGQNTPQGVLNIIQNPITEDSFHVYRVDRFKFNTKQGYTYTGTTLGMPAPETQHHDIEIDLHGVQQKYPSYASVTSDINNIYMVVWTDQLLTNMGFADSFAFSSDCEFHDVQDAL